MGGGLERIGDEVCVVGGDGGGGGGGGDIGGKRRVCVDWGGGWCEDVEKKGWGGEEYWGIYMWFRGWLVGEM